MNVQILVLHYYYSEYMYIYNFLHKFTSVILRQMIIPQHAPNQGACNDVVEFILNS
jgi:hypothetical protein